jgi:hypothetical protein
MWEDLQHVSLLPGTRADPVERMRNADERPLIFQPPNSLLGREKRRYLLGHEGGQELSTGGQNFLAHDDQLRVQFSSRQRSLDGVVVGHHHPVDSLAATCLNKFSRCCE